MPSSRSSSKKSMAASPRTRRIGILVFDGFEPIDVFGFVEAFSIARFLATDYDSPSAY